MTSMSTKADTAEMAKATREEARAKADDEQTAVAGAASKSVERDPRVTDAVDHRPHGTLTGHATEPVWNGYLLTVACPCGVTFERWVTPEEAERELVALI